MKRSAQQELSKNIIQTPVAQEQEKEATTDEIAARRILKIKDVKNDDKQLKSTEQLNNEKGQPGIQLTAKLTFSPIDNNKSQEQQKPLFTGGLFNQTTPSVNLFAQPTTGGLFGNLGEQKPITQAGVGGLFGNLQTPSIFPSSEGLFGQLPEGWKKSGPAKNDEEDEDDGEGDNEPLESKSDQGNAEESKVNFEYKFDFEKIINVKFQIIFNKLKPQIGINKFRINQQDPSLQGFISLEKLKGDKDQYIIVYRNATKLILHQGIILKVTQFCNFNNREDCLQMSSYELIDAKEEGEKKEEEQNKKEGDKEKPSKKLQKSILKIMFKNKEECKEFIKALENAIDQLKKLE